MINSNDIFTFIQSDRRQFEKQLKRNFSF